jgi:hypothetical protein
MPHTNRAYFRITLHVSYIGFLLFHIHNELKLIHKEFWQEWIN